MLLGGKYSHVRGRSGRVSRKTKINVIGVEYAPKVGSRVVVVLTEFRFVRADNVVPVTVANRDTFNRLLFASTIDYGSVPFFWFVVDDAGRVALLVLLPT